MKISGLNKQISEQKVSSRRVGGNGGSSFSQNFDSAQREHTQQQLKKMLQDVQNTGKKLKNNANDTLIQEYKKLIKEYLTYVLQNFYRIKHDHSVNYQTVQTRVVVINQEVEALTLNLLQEEKDNFDLIATIDRITGLLIDIYS